MEDEKYPFYFVPAGPKDIWGVEECVKSERINIPNPYANQGENDAVSDTTAAK